MNAEVGATHLIYEYRPFLSVKKFRTVQPVRFAFKQTYGFDTYTVEISKLRSKTMLELGRKSLQLSKAFRIILVLGV